MGWVLYVRAPGLAWLYLYAQQSSTMLLAGWCTVAVSRGLQVPCPCRNMIDVIETEAIETNPPTDAPMTAPERAFHGFQGRSREIVNGLSWTNG